MVYIKFDNCHEVRQTAKLKPLPNNHVYGILLDCCSTYTYGSCMRVYSESGGVCTFVMIQMYVCFKTDASA